MSEEVDYEPKSEAERRILLWALLLNAGLSAALAIVGFIADSSALIANAVDNASDAAVYAISFMAVKRGARWKRAAARASGVMLLGVAFGVMADVIRRFVGDPQPVGPAIMVMALVAAIVNMVCLRLLSAIRKNDVNLRAAWTFSLNDLIGNMSVILAGGLVFWLGRAWPDLVIGFAIAAVAAKGGLAILRDASRSANAA